MKLRKLQESGQSTLDFEDTYEIPAQKISEQIVKFAKEEFRKKYYNRKIDSFEEVIRQDMMDLEELLFVVGIAVL